MPIELTIFASKLRGGKSFLQILLDDPPKNDRYKKLKLNSNELKVVMAFFTSFHYIKDLKCR